MYALDHHAMNAPSYALIVLRIFNDQYSPLTQQIMSHKKQIQDFGEMK